MVVVDEHFLHFRKMTFHKSVINIIATVLRQSCVIMAECEMRLQAKMGATPLLTRQPSRNILPVSGDPLHTEQSNEHNHIDTKQVIDYKSLQLKIIHIGFTQFGLEWRNLLRAICRSERYSRRGIAMRRSLPQICVNMNINDYKCKLTELSAFMAVPVYGCAYQQFS